jgi:hypothetical protein
VADARRNRGESGDDTVGLLRVEEQRPDFGLRDHGAPRVKRKHLLGCENVLLADSLDRRCWREPAPRQIESRGLHAASPRTRTATN